MNDFTRWSVLVLALLAAAPALASDDSDDETETVPAPAPPADDSAYRFLSYPEIVELERTLDFDAGALADCRDENEDVRRRERTVTNRLPYTLYVLADGTLTARYTGDDDADGEIQECLLEEIGDMELEPADASLANARFRTVGYEHNYYDRRRTRHAEVIALYTLSGVAGAVAIGSFVAADADSREFEERSQGSSPSAGLARLEDRPDRFRAAGFAMVGVSVVSFVTGTLLNSANRRIENAENPVLVLSPGSPTGDLGFTFSSRF